MDVASSLQIFLAALAGWLSGRQQDVIGYPVEENRVLRAQLRGRLLRLTDDHRRRLAVRGQHLGRAALRQVATIVTPDTILRLPGAKSLKRLRKLCFGTSRHRCSASLSKRAQSTTLTFLRLESITYGLWSEPKAICARIVP
jgi:hypothetical protein